MAFGDYMTIDTGTLKSVEAFRDESGGFTLTADSGWSFGVTAEESAGFVPKEGDKYVLAQVGNSVSGIIVEGHVFRWQSVEEVKEQFEQWKKNYRLEKLERYVSEFDSLKERVKALPTPLRKRMERFDKESGVDFWIDSAGYEMACLEGAAALLRKVAELHLITSYDDPSLNTETQTEAAVSWINDWWDINSDKHDPPYDYKKQMEIVPDFGDGHSGNTAGAAKALAVFVLQGNDV